MEPLRLLLNDVAAVDKARSRKVLTVNHVSRPFFEASTQRNLCNVLPDEDNSEGDKRGDIVGHLYHSLLAFDMRHAS